MEIDALFQSLLAGDSPLTLAILAYIVYLLHTTDDKQDKALKWLRKSVIALTRKVSKLEDFIERKFPNEWRRPRTEDHDEDDF